MVSNIHKSMYFYTAITKDKAFLKGAKTGKGLVLFFQGEKSGRRKKMRKNEKETFTQDESRKKMGIDTSWRYLMKHKRQCALPATKEKSVSKLLEK